MEHSQVVLPQKALTTVRADLKQYEITVWDCTTHKNGINPLGTALSENHTMQGGATSSIACLQIHFITSDEIMFLD